MIQSRHHTASLCAVIAALLVIGCSPNSSISTFEGKVSSAVNLKPGASKEDVIRLLGEPNEVTAKPDREALTWRHPSDGYGTLVLNFEKGAFTMGGAFLKGQKPVRLGTAKKD